MAVARRTGSVMAFRPAVRTEGRHMTAVRMGMVKAVHQATAQDRHRTKVRPVRAAAIPLVAGVRIPCILMNLQATVGIDCRTNPPTRTTANLYRTIGISPITRSIVV
jgi:hypothetical protein